MTMRITMLQARMGEAGSVLAAGTTNTVSDAFGASMVGMKYATDTDGALTPPNSNPARLTSQGGLLDGSGSSNQFGTTVGIAVGNKVTIPTFGVTYATGQGSQRSHYATKQGDILSLTFTDVFWFIDDSFVVNTTGTSSTATFAKYVEYPQGTFTPVTFAGSATYIINNTTVRQLTSDPLSITIPAGAQWWEHTVQVTGSNRAVPVHEAPANHSVIGSGDCIYTTTANAPAHQASGDAGVNTFGAALITGIVAAVNAKAVLGVGDSIVFGQGDITSSGSKGGSGWLERKIDALGLPITKFAKKGMSASNLAALITANATPFAEFAALLPAAHTDVICEYGINDLRLGRTQAQILADHQTIYGKFPNAVIGQTTLTARSDSTDGWVTEVNQTPKTDGNMAALNSVNAAIRARPAKVSTVLEVANLTMSAPDSDIWKAPPNLGFTPVLDGTHPTSAMAGYISINLPLRI